MSGIVESNKFRTLRRINYLVADNKKLREKLEVIGEQCKISQHSPIKGRSHLARKILGILEEKE